MRRCPVSGPRRPYSPAEIDGYLALAGAQPTTPRRMRAAALVCLGAGAGLIRSDLRQARPGHLGPAAARPRRRPGPGPAPQRPRTPGHPPGSCRLQRESLLPGHAETAPAADPTAAQCRNRPRRRPRRPDRRAGTLQTRTACRRSRRRLPPPGLPRRHRENPLHPADHHRQPGSRRQDPAEARLPLAGMAGLLPAAHRSRAAQLHHQRHRHQLDRPRLDTPHRHHPAHALARLPIGRPQPAHPHRLGQAATRPRPPRRRQPAAPHPQAPPRPRRRSARTAITRPQNPAPRQPPAHPCTASAALPRHRPQRLPHTQATPTRPSLHPSQARQQTVRPSGVPLKAWTHRVG